MIFKFEPIYHERVWGGQMLNTKLQREIPHSAKIGESWDIVDRDDINSTMSKPFANVSSLRNLIQQEPKKIMGPQWMPDQKFPILVKWLDCSERLSLQVHPPELVAKKFSGEPKTENWYIGYASNDAGLFVGLKKHTTKEKFRSAVNNGTAEKYCHRIKSNRGDSILIESGRIHAIDAGNLILEIQQNSDTTYRVFDWDRNGLDGVPRKLHIEKSMECIDFNDFEPSILKTSGRSKMQNLAGSKEFRIRKFNLDNGQSIVLKDENMDCSIVHLISGEIKVGEEKLRLGEHGLSPFNQKCIIQALENSTFLVTDRFNKLL